MSERVAIRRRALFFARLSFALVGTMPWWLPLVAATLPLGPLRPIFDFPFLFICHRLPARTLVIAGEAMPVCSRCAGIFTGLAIGALLCWPRLSIQRARIALAGAGVLMLTDVLTQDFGLHPVWHATRLATGALLGWVACAALMTAIIGDAQSPRAAQPSPAPPAP